MSGSVITGLHRFLQLLASRYPGHQLSLKSEHNLDTSIYDCNCQNSEQTIGLTNVYNTSKSDMKKFKYLTCIRGASNAT